MRGLWSSLLLLAVFLLSNSTAADNTDTSKSSKPSVAQAPPVVGDIGDDFIPSKTDKRSLGSYSAAEPSPFAIGVKIGETWYDQQHNGSMGRMIDWGINGDTMLVHFSWMWLNSAPGLGIELDRRYRYNYYNATTGQLASDSGYPAAEYWSGYVGIDVRNDNVPIVGGHESEYGPGNRFRPAFFWGGSPGEIDFLMNKSVIPDSLAYYSVGNFIEASWPKFRVQEGPFDTVLHVVAATVEEWLGTYDVRYFRKVGTGSSGAWEFPPLILGRLNTLSHDIAASNSTGKVAIAWTTHISGENPCNPVADTLPIPEPVQYQKDNDVHYQVSYDQGVTWQPEVNLTCNVDGEAGHRAFRDLSVLIDTDDNLHIVWNGRVWPADASTGGEIGIDCSIFHWSESVPYITKIHDAEWDQTTCSGDWLQLNTGKMTISECNGRFYCLWVQFNDIPRGVEDDCAERAFLYDDSLYSANGDLWFSVSRDDGLNWDRARNITETYSSNCAPGDCLSEHWPSMAKFGTDVGGNWSGAEIVDPTSSYAGNHYLDVQYVLDKDPAQIVWDYGTWTLNELRWFRLPCVDSTYTADELCCIGNRGNVNGDPEDAVNISDLTCMIGYLFGPPLPPEPLCAIACITEANTNGDPDETINISDVTYLVSYLFGNPNGPAPGSCPY